MEIEPRSQWDDGDFAEVMRAAGYDVYERIGGTETADIFLAYQTRLDRQVVLKRMLPQLAADPVMKKRFIEESRKAAAIGHDHIIPIYDVGEVRRMVYAAIRYTPAGNAAAMLRSETAAGRHLPVRRVAEMVAQVASALDAAHAVGLVHRDVRPANMLLDAEMDAGMADHVYLADFGLTQRSFQAPGPAGEIAFDGTVGYAAPEQLAGRPVAGSDQYSLGCSAFEMLTGHMPFGDFASPLPGRPPLVTSLRRDLDYEVDVVFAKVLASSPAGRYANCGEFADHLAAALGARSAPESAPDARPRPAWPVGLSWGSDPDRPLEKSQPSAAKRRVFARYQASVQRPDPPILIGKSLEPARTRPVIRLRMDQLDVPDLAVALDQPKHPRHRRAHARSGQVVAGLTGIMAILAVVTVLLATLTGHEPGAAPRSSAELTPSSAPSARNPASSAAPTSPGGARPGLPPLMQRLANQPSGGPASPGPRVSTSPPPGTPHATPTPKPTPTPRPRPTPGPTATATPTPTPSQAASYSQLAALSSGYYMDVYNASTDEYATIDLWYDNGNPNQQFSYPNQDGQVAEIVSQNSGMCVTTDGTAGDTLYQYPCNNDAGQRWQAEVWTDSYDYPGETMVTFLNPASGLVIDIYDNSYDAGANVDAWYPNQQTNQAFVLLG